MSTPRNTKDKSAKDGPDSAAAAAAAKPSEEQAAGNAETAPQGGSQASDGEAAQPPAEKSSQVGESVVIADEDLLFAIASPGLIRVRALRNIEHDGKLYGPEQICGDEFDIAPGQLEVLHPTGAIERV